MSTRGGRFFARRGGPVRSIRPAPPLVIADDGSQSEDEPDYGIAPAPAPAPGVPPAPPAEKYSSGAPLGFQVAGVYEAPSPNDVELSFPRAGQATLKLWTSAKLLSAVSPYYKTMLSSGFKEAQASSAVGDEGSTLLDGPEAGLDSDTELDSFYRTVQQDILSVDPIKRVVVTEASYATWKALLSWIHTGHIVFAPLQASFPDQDSRQNYFKLKHQHAPHRPLPCSAKSMFKLAHLLEIPSLAQIALDAYIGLIESKFAHKEVFSSMLHYDQVKERLTGYLVAHKGEVMRTGGFEAVKAALKRGELDEVGVEASEVLLELVG